MVNEARFGELLWSEDSMACFYGHSIPLEKMWESELGWYIEVNPDEMSLEDFKENYIHTLENEYMRSGMDFVEERFMYFFTKGGKQGAMPVTLIGWKRKILKS